MLMAVPVMRAVLRIELPSHRAWAIWLRRLAFNWFIVTILYLSAQGLSSVLRLHCRASIDTTPG